MKNHLDQFTTLKLITTMTNSTENKSRTANSTYPKGGVLCSVDNFVVTESSVLLINIFGEKPTHRKSAKLYLQALQAKYKQTD